MFLFHPIVSQIFGQISVSTFFKKNCYKNEYYGKDVAFGASNNVFCQNCHGKAVS